MRIRFRKSIKIVPGLRLNLSDSGHSWTVGPRGFSVNIGKRGTFLNVSLRGTGLYAREKIGPGLQNKPKKEKYRPPLLAHYEVPSQERKPLTGLARKLGKRCAKLFRPTPPPHPTSLRCEAGKDGKVRILNSRGVLLSPTAIERIRRAHDKAYRRFILTSCAQLNRPIEMLGEIVLNTPRPGLHPTYKPESFSTAQPSPPALAKVTVIDRLLWKRHRRMRTANTEALNKHRKETADWYAAKAAFENEEPQRRRDAETLVYRDMLVMQKVLSRRLQAIPWPLPTTSEFILREEGRAIALTIRVTGREQLPAHYATSTSDQLSLTLTGLAPDLVQLHAFRYAYNVLFRTVGEVFATLPTVKIATAFCRIPDVGDSDIAPLVAIQVHKDEWLRFNFAHLDKLDAAKQLAPYVRQGFGATRIWRAAP